MIKAIVMKQPGKDEMVLAGQIRLEEVKKFMNIGWTFDREADYNKHGIPVVDRSQYLRWAE